MPREKARLYTRSLAWWFATYNIRVNAVASGFIKKDDCNGQRYDGRLLSGERYASAFIGK